MSDVSLQLPEMALRTASSPSNSPASRCSACRDRSGPAMCTRAARGPLGLVSPALKRSASGRLIPMRKSGDWWRHTQGERRAIFDGSSHRLARSLSCLPAIARALLRGGDPGEPHADLAWFEFFLAEAGAFGDLLAKRRSTPEWAHVDRELEVRVSRSTRA